MLDDHGLAQCGRHEAGGDFEYAADYWLTATAIPLGSGRLLHTVGVHRLQRGRDGRLGTAGTWLFAACVVELVVQCMTSVVLGRRVRASAVAPVPAMSHPLAGQ